MRSIVAIVSFFLAFSTAESSTVDERALTKMAATLAYGETRCPHLEGNMQALAIIAVSRHFSPDDWRKGGRLRPLLEAHIQVVKAEFDSTDDKMFCLALETAFGPNGVKAPNAMTRRSVK